TTPDWGCLRKREYVARARRADCNGIAYACAEPGECSASERRDTGATAPSVQDDSQAEPGAMSRPNEMTVDGWQLTASHGQRGREPRGQSRWRWVGMLAIACALTLLLPSFASAQGIPAVTVTTDPSGGQQYSLTLQILILMTAVTLLPGIVLMMTSFTR